MKKFFGLIIITGFTIMLGGAGSADNTNMSFMLVLMLELLGISLILLGISLNLNYKKYLRRRLRKRSVHSNALKNVSARAKSVNICKRQKELC